uniref:Methyl-CpG-binding domain-containing protein 2 n=1 Tax=Kalanchoe fedtschenkoi TaxID=63787 RepID=A0A7N0R8W8_KALFE
MQSLNGKVSPEVNKKETTGFNYTGSSPPGESDSTVKEDTELSSSEDGDRSDDENNFSSANAQNQLVVYDPLTNGAGEVVHAPEPLSSQPLSSARKDPNRVLPAVGAYTVQCANCFQWRLIPTKEKYEEIRESVIEKPFYCKTASEWRPGISCDDPGDIQQDNSRLWAIDKPNIPRPPPGWQRLLRIRGEGSSKFADVYYVAPSGKRFRSLVEIQKYFALNPELTAELNISQFSFQIPKPLQEDYVRKRPSGMKSSRALDSGEASPLAWVNPSDSVELRLGQPEPSPSSFEMPVRHSSDQPARKRPKKSLAQGSTALS